ncbi:MAG TPA: Hsp70 family protein [Tepidisphaeraceae bacterium]|jgi:molecular chaperone DnaK|nr:Hsp70 family protein [Tepidisphaeraceae bacterium]
MTPTIDFGIDLGTTNSSIGLCRQGEVRIFQTTDLMNVTPSVVYVSKSGRMLVGKKAYDTWVADPENTQAEFKRWMGFSDQLKFPASGKVLSAEELSAEVLKSLRADAERATQEQIRAAVITVPAAFGSLQCDATGRAAKLAGFEQAPLLQEPIAAAVAYGASPASRNQRWMVFDLGGGTLDIAIVSTRNSRLAVLEHQGNNRLGGKDIDRMIAETFLFEPLSQNFHFAEGKDDPQARNRLMRALVRYAEQAKISLSTAPQATIEIFDIGDDADGKPIEATITLNRAEMEAKMTPIIDQCLDLARRALEGARLSAADLDRLLLVGGPTQMPILRDALQNALGAKLDYSLDPMTVVSNGAALYASTLEKAASSAAASAPAAKAATPAGTVKCQLAYERASGSAQSPVAGIIDAKAGVQEIKIDAGNGFWTSGWVAVVNGSFQLDVMLHNTKPVTHYTISARDRTGNLIRLEPAQFSVTYMLPMAAPPLPHTVAIELSTTNGVTKFDPVFTRHSPLPAEVRKTYKADRTLRPSEIESTLPIKFWEIEVSDDPQEKWWAGCVHIRAEKIKRPILEGSDLELTVKIDASRKMSVELFVPLLNQSFSDDVYLPDPPSARSQLQQQLDMCFERLAHVRTEVYEADRPDLAPRIEQLQMRAEQIADQVSAEIQSGRNDPDASLAPTESLRKLRMQIMQMEEQLNIGSETPGLARKMRWQVRYIERIVADHGTETEKHEYAKLLQQYERYCETDDIRGLRWVQDQMWTVHYGVIRDQAWFWRNRLAVLKSPGQRFINHQQAMKVIADAEAAEQRNDLPALRTACNKGYALLPPDQAEAARDQETQSGLR